MKILPIRTESITAGSTDIVTILDRSLTQLEEGSVLAITSKIVALCDNRVADPAIYTRNELVTQEADYYLPPEASKYGFTLTIKDGILIPSAGIDGSNSNGYFILWPTDSQQTANKVRQYLADRFNLTKVGVIITDSRTTPLRKGTTGIGLAHSGFAALNNYVGRPDIFNEPLKVTQANIMDGLAAAAVMVMGEGNEQTPLAVITDIPQVAFQDRNPNPEELAQLNISLEEDLYAPIFTQVNWIKGNQKPPR